MAEMHIAASPVWESWSELSTRLPRDLDLDELARTSHAIQRHRGDGVSDGATLLRLRGVRVAKACRTPRFGRI
jgi:hypothetical protein